MHFFSVLAPASYFDMPEVTGDAAAAMTAAGFGGDDVVPAPRGV